MIETLAKLSMAGLLVVSVPPTTDPSLWAQWGLAGMVVAYVLWRDAHRERRMAAACAAQERWIRETLMQALERNTRAMESMVRWMEQRGGGDAER